jgi:hypothetical protein
MSSGKMQLTWPLAASMLPKTGATMARDKQFKMKATREELDRWHNAAAKRGTTASAYVRAVLDRLAKRTEKQEAGE